MSGEEGILRIELPIFSVSESSFHQFIDTRTDTIRSLIIEQRGYYGYAKSKSGASVVSIPDTIERLTEVRQISIRARVETLPNSLSKL